MQDLSDPEYRKFLQIAYESQQWGYVMTKQEESDYNILRRRALLTSQCKNCGKMITDDEYVCNWTWCSDCLDKDYITYLKEHPQSNVEDYLEED